MKTKTAKIALGGFGSYLGMEKGRFTVRDDLVANERHNTLFWRKAQCISF